MVQASSARRQPTLTVWVATVLLILICGAMIVEGMAVIVGRELLGVGYVMAAVFLLGTQWLALRGRVISSFIVGVLAILGGAAVVLLRHEIVGGACLFVGVAMIRWAIRLRRDQRSTAR